MKKLSTTLVLFWVFSLGAFSQHCSSASATIPNNTAVAFYGFTPPDASQPCAGIGSPVSDTIYMHVWDSVSLNSGGIRHHLFSLTIDSIDLPPGLCWETNAATNLFTGGGYGAILISGTPTGPPGQYNLRIYVHGTEECGSTCVLIFSERTLDSLTGQTYALRVTCPGSSCPAINTADTTDFYIPYGSGTCSSISASITPAGTVSVCPGDSLTLTADSSAGYTYLWSTGATTRSITVSTAASYVVTVYSGSDSAVSAPTIVSVAALPDTALTLSGPASFCMGDSLLIMAAPGLSYLWSTSAATRSIEVSASGTYSVTVSNGVPCTAASRSISVTVAALPDTALTVSGPVVFCQGDSVQLSAASGLSYRWSNALSTQSIEVTASGSYSVTVTNGAPCTAVSRMVAVTVEPAPDTALTLSGPAVFCQGDSVQISAASGFSYHWSNSSASQRIAVATTGNYSVTVSSGLSCSAVSRTVEVIVEPVPDTALTVSGPTVFCQGDSVQISATSGFNYQWSNTATSRSIEVTASGNYSVTVTNAVPCTAVSRTVSVTVNMPPAATATLNGADSLSASSAPAYQWYHADTLLSGDTSQMLTAPYIGYYYVMETSAAGCSAVSDSVDVLKLNTAIYGPSAAVSLRLYPNPNPGVFTLEIPAGMTGSYEVHDMQGRLIRGGAVSYAQTSIDMSAQPAGVYYLTIRTAKWDETMRFTVLR